MTLTRIPYLTADILISRPTFDSVGDSLLREISYPIWDKCQKSVWNSTSHSIWFPVHEVVKRSLRNSTEKSLLSEVMTSFCNCETPKIKIYLKYRKRHRMCLDCGKEIAK